MLLRGQILHGALCSCWHDQIGQTGITNRPIGRKAHAAGGRDDPAAPVAEAIATGRDWHGRADGQVVGHEDVGCSRKMRANQRDQRSAAESRKSSRSRHESSCETPDPNRLHLLGIAPLSQ
jgi:hypothetical protein